MRYTRRFVVAAVVPLLIAVAPQAEAQTQKPPFDIIFKTTPNPPVTGKNTIEVTVKDASGKPVADADVSATFIMAAMPSMKMPEMRNTVALKHVKDGTYSGAGQVMMAGNWDVTVSVKRSGKEIASKKFPVTAR